MSEEREEQKPPPPPPRRDSTARSRQLGEELKARRLAAGWKSHRLAGELRWSQAKIVKLENGERNTSDTDVAAYLTLCGVRGEEFQRLVALSRESAKDTWVQPFGADPATRTRTLRAEEARATAIACYDCALVPGLLQTIDYASSVVVDDAADLRIARQRVLDRVGAVFFVEESALHRRVASSAIMHDQMMHILLTRATVRVIPSRSRAHGALDGSFVLLDNADQRPVVYLETMVANIFLENPDHVTAYRRALSDLSRVALGAEQSRVLLTELADRYGRPREEHHAGRHRLA